MIPVIWHAMERGRGIFDSTAMLNDMFDHCQCNHYGFHEPTPPFDGAVVVVHGGREIGEVGRLNADIQRLRWVILVFLGDEESTFPVEKVQHANKKIWIQEPIPGQHDFADRFMVNGYGHDRMRYISKCDKDLDWFFGGQVTHGRRRACVDALRKLDWGGVVIETKGYYQGISMAEYLRTMCRAKIVPCPSGPFSPDAARPWDALECGAIPILDDLSPTRTDPGFWKYVLGDHHPLPVITDWDALPDMIAKLKLGNIERLTAECVSWWFDYKTRFNKWLVEDLSALGAK